MHRQRPTLAIPELLYRKWLMVLRYSLYRVAIMRQQVSLMGVEGGVSREALSVPVLLVRKAVDIVRTWNRNHLSTG